MLRKVLPRCGPMQASEFLIISVTYISTDTSPQKVLGKECPLVLCFATYEKSPESPGLFS